MNIYIPKHIKKIGVVDKMCKLIEGYANSQYVVNIEDSFNNYNYYLKTDPVIKFLHICISRDTWNNNHPSEDYDSVISYISRLFYSTKGTCKVFDYIQKYLELDIYDIQYTVKKLSFTIREVNLVDIDEKVFYDSLIDFLEALLYFGEVTIRIENIKLWLSNTLQNYIGEKTITYKEYTTVRYGEG